MEEHQRPHGVPVFDMREVNEQSSSEDSNVRVLHYYIGGTTLEILRMEKAM